jgi:hypothetical protein
VPCCIKKIFDVPEYRSHKCVIVEIKGNVVREPHTLQCHAMTYMETKLKQVSRLNVSLDNFSMTFSKSLPVVDKRQIGRQFWGNFGSLSGFGNIVTFASSQDFEK